MKRQRENSDDEADIPKCKRARLFEDLSFNAKAIDQTINILTLDYEKEKSGYQNLDTFHRKKMDYRYYEYLNQLCNARKEVGLNCT